MPTPCVVVTRTVTGSQLYAALENGVSFAPGRNGRFPQMSGKACEWGLPAGGPHST